VIFAALFALLFGPPAIAPVAREQLREMSGFRTEALACLVGHDSTVDRVVVVQADGNPTHIEPRSTCPDSTIGYAHNHPGAVRCWYVFPGTSVPTSDAMAAQASPYRFDAIVCGPVLVWNARGAVEVVTL